MSRGKRERDILAVVGMMQQWERTASDTCEALRVGSEDAREVNETELADSMLNLAAAIERHDRARTAAIMRAIREAEKERDA